MGCGVGIWVTYGVLFHFSFFVSFNECTAKPEKRGFSLNVLKNVLRWWVCSLGVSLPEGQFFPYLSKNKIFFNGPMIIKNTNTLNWKEHKTIDTINDASKSLCKSVTEQNAQNSGSRISRCSDWIQAVLYGRVHGRRSKGLPRRQWIDEIWDWTKCEDKWLLIYVESFVSSSLASRHQQWGCTKARQSKETG